MMPTVASGLFNPMLLLRVRVKLCGSQPRARTGFRDQDFAPLPCLSTEDFPITSCPRAYRLAAICKPTAALAWMCLADNPTFSHLSDAPLLLLNVRQDRHRPVAAGVNIHRRR